VFSAEKLAITSNAMRRAGDDDDPARRGAMRDY
jgi:hypothetical protein